MKAFLSYTLLFSLMMALIPACTHTHAHACKTSAKVAGPLQCDKISHHRHSLAQRCTTGPSRGNPVRQKPFKLPFRKPYGLYLFEVWDVVFRRQRSRSLKAEQARPRKQSSGGHACRGLFEVHLQP